MSESRINEVLPFDSELLRTFQQAKKEDQLQRLDDARTLALQEHEMALLREGDGQLLTLNASPVSTSAQRKANILTKGLQEQLAVLPKGKRKR